MWAGLVVGRTWENPWAGGTRGGVGGVEVASEGHCVVRCNQVIQRTMLIYTEISRSVAGIFFESLHVMCVSAGYFVG